MVEFAIAERLEPWLHAGEHSEVLTEAFGLLGVDLKKLEKDAKTELERKPAKNGKAAR